MKYYKFICNWQTERECFYRRLLGNDKPFVEDSGEKLDVSAGDTLFLHRRHSSPDRFGYLYGPFTATTDAQPNIEPEAWRYLGGFDWQVRIKATDDGVYSRSMQDFHENIDNPPADITDYAQILTEIEGRWLTGAVKDGDPIIIPE